MAPPAHEHVVSPSRLPTDVGVAFAVRYVTVDGSSRTVVLLRRVWEQFGAWRAFARALPHGLEDRTASLHAVTVVDDLRSLVLLLSPEAPSPPRAYRTSLGGRAALQRRYAHALYETALDCAQLAVRWQLDGGGRLRERLRHMLAEAATAFVPLSGWWPGVDTETAVRTVCLALEAGVDLRDETLRARVSDPEMDAEALQALLRHLADAAPVGRASSPLSGRQAASLDAE